MVPKRGHDHEDLRNQPVAWIKKTTKGLLMGQAQAAMKEDFAALLDESFKKSASIEGSVLKGSVVRIDDDFVLVDVMNVPGMIFVMTMYYVPYGYLLVGAALRNMDPSLEDASYINGNGHVRTAFRVTLPLVRPAMAAAFFFIARSIASMAQSSSRYAVHRQ